MSADNPSSAWKLARRQMPEFRVASLSEAEVSDRRLAYDLRRSINEARSNIKSRLFEGMARLALVQGGAAFRYRLHESAQDLLLAIALGCEEHFDQAYDGLADCHPSFDFVHCSHPSWPDPEPDLRPPTIRESHRARMLSEMRELFERTQAAIAADEAEAERGRVQHILSLDPARRS